MLVTTAEDGQFKAWCQDADEDTQRESNPPDVCKGVSVGLRSQTPKVMSLNPDIPVSPQHFHLCFRGPELLVV